LAWNNSQNCNNRKKLKLAVGDSFALRTFLLKYPGKVIFVFRGCLQFAFKEV